MNSPTLSLQESLSLKCKIEGIKYQSLNSDFKVLKLKVVDVYSGPSEIKKGSTIIAIGECISEVLISELPLHITGEWEYSQKYGHRLRIKSYIPVAPSSKDGIIRYLASGTIRGIGEATAKKMVERFGDKTLEVLDNSPEKIKEIKGIGQNKAEVIIRSWKNQRNIAELLSALCTYGLSVSYAKKALHHFGTDAVKIIRENPYALTELQGIGFYRADVIAKMNGIRADHPERIKAAILYIMENATYSEGHCYLPEEELINRAGKILSIETPAIANRLHDSDMSEKLYSKNERVYLKYIYSAELLVSEKIINMAYSKNELLLPVGNLDLTEEQHKAVVSSLSRKLTCITGLPGTGKTTIIRELVSILEKNGYRYHLAAPTGKAAKRIHEQTGREAKTIHRLLEFGRDGTFSRNEKNPLEGQFIIIDESSMIDICLMSSLMRAIRNGASIVLIGDCNQLPPIGPGNVFKEIVNKGLCHVSKLTKLHRQAENSMINIVAKKINTGESVGLSRIFGEDYTFKRIDSPEEIKREIMKEVLGTSQIQVISPMKRGVIGTMELNKSIREILFGKDDENGNNLKVGDKVIQKYNNYEKGVFNGEIGYVIEVDKINGYVVIKYDDQEVVYEDYETDEVDFAYALTVHKSQGSEYDYVVMPVCTAHYVMLFRNLLYTAVTRAKKKIILIGTETALNIAVKNDKPIIRYTTLGEL